nr:MAG TPA: hypothetical protein [Caudoviricetes sp.]
MLLLYFLFDATKVNSIIYICNKMETKLCAFNYY